VTKASTIELRLTRAEALVLFEWISRHGDGAPVDDDAERQVLWRLEGLLETLLTEPLEADYREAVAAARRTVRGS
jgi:hypothetical protein